MWKHYLDYHGLEPSMFEEPKPTQIQTQTYDYETDTEADDIPFNKSD